MQGKCFESTKGLIICLSDEIVGGRCKVKTCQGHIYNLMGAVLFGRYLSACTWQRSPS